MYAYYIYIYIHTDLGINKYWRLRGSIELLGTWNYKLSPKLYKSGLSHPVLKPMCHGLQAEASNPRGLGFRVLPIPEIIPRLLVGYGVHACQNLGSEIWV